MATARQVLVVCAMLSIAGNSWAWNPNFKTDSTAIYQVAATEIMCPETDSGVDCIYDFALPVDSHYADADVFLGGYYIRYQKAATKSFKRMKVALEKGMYSGGTFTFKARGYLSQDLNSRRDAFEFGVWVMVILYDNNNTAVAKTAPYTTPVCTGNTRAGTACNSGIVADVTGSNHAAVLAHTFMNGINYDILGSGTAVPLSWAADASQFAPQNNDAKVFPSCELTEGAAMPGVDYTCSVGVVTVAHTTAAGALATIYNYNGNGKAGLSDLQHHPVTSGATAFYLGLNKFRLTSSAQPSTLENISAACRNIVYPGIYYPGELEFDFAADLADQYGGQIPFSCTLRCDQEDLK